jgi:hypothetical protein
MSEREPCAFCQTVNEEGREFCAGCGVVLPGIGGGVPWEKRRSLGFVSALLETIAQIFRQPSAFFARVCGETKHRGALLFAMTVGFFATLIETVWTLSLFGEDARSGVTVILENEKVANFLENLFRVDNAGLMEKAFDYFMAAGVVFAPLVAVIEVYCVSALIYLAMKAFSVPGRKFSLLLELIALTQVSQLALILPSIGGLIASILGIIFIVIALGVRFRLPRWKAIFLAIFPHLLVLSILMVLMLVSGFAMGPP